MTSAMLTAPPTTRPTTTPRTFRRTFIRVTPPCDDAKFRGESVSRAHAQVNVSRSGFLSPAARHGLQLAVLGPTLDGGSSLKSLAQLQEGGGHAAVQEAHPE